uniref:Uncharacterized protein n=1 Tax=Arundo donax TaxID=35708 RepID=A0A0A9FT22_ARUDO
MRDGARSAKAPRRSTDAWREATRGSDGREDARRRSAA